MSLDLLQKARLEELRKIATSPSSTESDIERVVSEYEEMIPARMSPDIEKPQLPPSIVSGDMWFMQVLDEREKTAVKMAYEYVRLGKPGLPNHLYMNLIHTLCELLNQVDVVLEDGS